ncbi:MAG TPA: hypothetical protein VM779_10735 [Thermoanaerobaculia bacterium]|nr:hypothetical protein [Thermoanaerobaculia bacterium]
MLTAVVGITILLAASGAGAQEPPPEPEPPPALEVPPAPKPEVDTDEIQTPEPFPDSPSVLSDAAASTYLRREALPDVNIYIPEMQMSIRLRRLIRNALFESQIDYEFIEGDISTYLRYKYYARNHTYRIGVFDTIEFPNIGEESTQEFERVRGALLLLGVPRDYEERYFWLLQGDAITFGDLRNVDNKRRNLYTKVAYQRGTQFDQRLNGIVGESRGRITPVLTAFRDIGPQRSSYAVALTQTLNITGGALDAEADRFDYSIGDYRYTKFEAEGLRRFDVTASSFIFSRLHIGLFGGYNEFTNRGDRPEPERYSVPRYELFRLGGRESLRAISEGDDSIGTHQVHITNEYFRPIFRNRDYRTGPLHWNTLYGILYLGAGTVGFGWDTLTRSEDFVVDAGIGFEASVAFHDFEVLLSAIWATTVKAPSCPEGDATLGCRDLQGRRIVYSVRTIR